LIFTSYSMTRRKQFIYHSALLVIIPSITLRPVLFKSNISPKLAYRHQNHTVQNGQTADNLISLSVPQR
jgi:hypothetical protein